MPTHFEWIIEVAKDQAPLDELQDALNNSGVEWLLAENEGIWYVNVNREITM